MSIMVDLPPAMAQEAREYATVQGTTLERMYCGMKAVNPFKEFGKNKQGEKRCNY